MMRHLYRYCLPCTAESLLDATLFVSAAAHVPVTDRRPNAPPSVHHEIEAASPDPPFANQITLIALVDGC